MFGTLTNICVSAFVAGLELTGDQPDWGDATQASVAGNLPVIGGLVRVVSDKRLRCCRTQLKKLEAGLEEFMVAEGVPDPQAVISDLETYAERLIKSMRVFPQDLGDWDGSATSSIAEKANSIAMTRLPQACEAIIDPESQRKFQDVNDPRYRTLSIIIRKLHEAFFAPPSEFDAALRAELQEVGIKLSAFRAEANEKLDKHTAMLEKLLAGASNEDALSAENENLKQQLAEALSALEQQNDPSSQEAEDDLLAGDPEKAKAFFRERAEAQEDVMGDAAKAAAENYRHLGAIAFLNDTQEALDAYRRATELDPENADGWNELGHLLQRLGEIDEAMAAYKQVLEIGEKTNDQKAIAAASGNLGILYKNRGYLDDAEKMYKKALKINEELESKEGMAADYANLGILYKTRGDLDDAEIMYKKSLKINEELESKEGIATDYGNLGLLYAKRGDLDTAISYWTKSLTLAREMGAALLVQQVESFFTNGNLDIPKG